MKKFAIACVAVLATAMSLTSCGDTNYCYEITAKAKVLGMEASYPYYEWCTSNELDTRKEAIKQSLLKLGADENTISITAKRTNKSQADCHK